MNTRASPATEALAQPPKVTRQPGVESLSTLVRGLLQAVVAIVLVACGGGGGSTSPPAQAPDIAYPQAHHSLTTGVPIATVSPSVTGGTVVAWAIDRPLPAGIAFSASTGQISGTPTAVSATGTYIVTATNAAGSDTFVLTMGVTSGAVFDLGHTRPVDALYHVGSRVLSVDRDRNIVLWNAQSGDRLLTTRSGCESSCGNLAAIKDQTVVVRNTDGFQVYDAATGAVASHIAVPQRSGTTWALATDGSYVVDYHDGGLSVWSREGTQLLARTGSFAGARIFAAAGELRIARGPAGTNVIETLTLSTGTSVISPAFASNFHSWFRDGERFFATAGGTVIVHSRTAVQESIEALPTISGLEGTGNWYWTASVPGYQLRIYAVGTGATPAVTYDLGSPGTTVHAEGGTLAFSVEGKGQISVVDLSGVTPVRTDHAVAQSNLHTFAAASPLDWVQGTSQGAILGEPTSGSRQRYSYGRVMSSAGSGSRFSIATASGDVLNFAAETRAYENRIEQTADRVQLSADGSLLAVGNARDLRLYALPSRMLLLNVPPPGPSSTLVHFDLSADGTRLVQTYFDSTGTGSGSYRHRAVASDGTVTPLNGIEGQRLRLSPSASLLSASSNFGEPNGPNVSVATNIYSNGTLTSAANGWAVEWLDDSRLFVNVLQDRRGTPQFDYAQIVNASGQIVATPQFALEVKDLQSIGNDQIYVGRYNTVYNALTGASVWSSAAPHDEFSGGAVAGSYVYFASGMTLRAEPR